MFRSKHERPQAPRPRKAKSTRQLTLSELDAIFPAFADYARYVLNHSPVSIRTYKSSYANFRHFLLDPLNATRSFADRMRDLDGWVAWNRKRGVGAMTTNSYWRSVRPFFIYLEKTYAILNPYVGAKTPPIPRHHLPKALRPEQLERVLAAARNYPWRTVLQRERATSLVAIMMFGGLRKGEVIRLQYSDVSLADGSIRIVAGKGRYGGKDRTIYMPVELRTILSSYLDVRRRMRFTCPEFFVSQGNRGLSDTQLRRIIRLVKIASGVPLFAHALRHSYITMLLRSRVPIHVVQALAGHADIKTTAMYTAVWDEDKRAAVQQLRLGTRRRSPRH